MTDWPRLPEALKASAGTPSMRFITQKSRLAHRTPVADPEGFET